MLYYTAINWNYNSLLITWCIDCVNILDLAHPPHHIIPHHILFVFDLHIVVLSFFLAYVFLFKLLKYNNYLNKNQFQAMFTPVSIKHIILDYSIQCCLFILVHFVRTLHFTNRNSHTEQFGDKVVHILAPAVCALNAHNQLFVPELAETLQKWSAVWLKNKAEQQQQHHCPGFTMSQWPAKLNYRCNSTRLHVVTQTVLTHVTCSSSV